MERGGPQLEQARGLLITFSEDGKMHHVRLFADQAEARAAAGLNEPTSA